MIASHQSHDKAEPGSLDQTGDDVDGLEVLLRAVEIGLRVVPELVDADQISAEDADDVGHEHQDRQRDQPGDEPRQHQVAQRVGGQRGQRVDLIGHAHRPDLRRHRRPDATGNHQSGYDRTKLTGNREHDNRRHRSLGGESTKPGM